nr:CBN-SDC-2 protein [Haemonchus contortus]
MNPSNTKPSSGSTPSVTGQSTESSDSSTSSSDESLGAGPTIGRNARTDDEQGTVGRQSKAHGAPLTGFETIPRPVPCRLQEDRNWAPVPDHVYYLSDANDSFLPLPCSTPPIVHAPRPMDRPYFPHQEPASQLTQYLCYNYDLAVVRYARFGTRKDSNIVPQPMQPETLHRFHMKGLHIHGFFWSVRLMCGEHKRPDMHTLYLQDIYYGRLYPLHLDFEQWTQEQQQLFRRTSNYLLRFFEAILTHRNHIHWPMFDETQTRQTSRNSSEESQLEQRSPGSAAKAVGQQSRCTNACKNVILYENYRKTILSALQQQQAVMSTNRYNPPPNQIPLPLTSACPLQNSFMVGTPTFACFTQSPAPQFLPQPSFLDQFGFCHPWQTPLMETYCNIGFQQPPQMAPLTPVILPPMPQQEPQASVAKRPRLVPPQFLTQNMARPTANINGNPGNEWAFCRNTIDNGSAVRIDDSVHGIVESVKTNEGLIPFKS